MTFLFIPKYSSESDFIEKLNDMDSVIYDSVNDIFTDLKQIDPDAMFELYISDPYLSSLPEENINSFSNKNELYIMRRENGLISDPEIIATLRVIRAHRSQIMKGGKK